MSDKKQLPDKCAVTRDLMPLCIDGTASEASQRRVKKHVVDCHPCATVYQEMQTQIDLDVPDQQETAQFDSAVKKVKHKHAWRKLRNVLLGIVLALVVCAGAAYGYYWYFVEEVPLSVDVYEMRAVLRSPMSPETPVVIKTTNLPKPAELHVELHYDGTIINGDNSFAPSWVMYIWATTTRSVNLETCGYTDNNYYAFDQVFEGENIYDAGVFLINGAQYDVHTIYKGAANEEHTLLFKRDMTGYDMKWSSENGTVLRNVASLEFVHNEKASAAYRSDPLSTVTPVATHMPFSTLAPVTLADSTPDPEERAVHQSTVAPKLTKAPTGD